MAASFGQMLMDRRRQMGLSIQQVANTVKIRPQIIEFFENEDFAAMPPRGYAQGMISSYARFLGLNPRIVVEAYLDALHEYESAAPGLGAGRFQDAAAEASPRSSNAQGRYYMVDSVPASRYGQRPPQAGYVSEATSTHQPVAASRLRSASIVNSRDPQAQGRPAEADATGAISAQGGGRTRGRGRSNQVSQQTARLQVVEGGTAQTNRLPQGQRQGGYQGGSGLQRTARQGSYQGRGQGGARTTQAGQTQYLGRQDARGNRNASASQRGRGGGRGSSGSGGGGGFLSGFDPRFLIVITALIVLVLAFLIFSGIQSCSAAEEDTGSTAVSTVTEVEEDAVSDTALDDEADAEADTDADTEADTESDADETDEDDGTDSDATDEDGGSDEDTEAEAATTSSDQTIVTISVADDAVAYLEVKLDGVSVLGSNQVGPVELEYTVDEQIVITTDSPSDVKVYLNGEKVSYDVKTSGVAKVTITASGSSSSSDDDSTEDSDTTEE